ncbi:MAG: endo-alpha-mannosidase [Ktedonobacteraceae bacterium]
MRAVRSSATVITFVLVGILVFAALIGTAVQTGNAHAQASVHQTVNPDRPVLAFYYPWYHQSDWCSCHMSDLPTIRYNSSDDSTIDRQVHWAANAGITGFINSWWGPGDQTDSNFAKVLAHAASLQQSTGYRFTSTVYIESDAPALQGMSNMVNGIHYLLKNYSANPYFIRWHGKTILFIWDPLGHGRTLSWWANVRHQIDPNNELLWSAEGVDASLLDVFDGIHLFSAGYWGLLHGNMGAVDQSFRAMVNNYNAIHHTNKIWAAGVMPGYDDTRIPGRTGTFVVPRNNGATYNTSWTAAIGSSPDWVTITSFNEWFEGSMIEPSVKYNMQYLDITQQYTKQWHG